MPFEAKVMVSIMSPRYMKSEWCLKSSTSSTRQLPTEEYQGGEKARIFKVIKTPIDARDIPEHIPQVLQSILGFEFFDFDPDTGRLVEYDEAFGERARQNYFSRIYDLAYEICDLLKNYQSGTPGALPAAPASKTDGKTIYLATTSSDLQVERDRIKRELTERGHRVLPDANLPLIGPELEGYLNEVLPHCDLAIHMVGARFGMIPEDAQCSVSELQNRLAAEHSQQRTRTHHLDAARSSGWRRTSDRFRAPSQ